MAVQTVQVLGEDVPSLRKRNRSFKRAMSPAASTVNPRAQRHLLLLGPKSYRCGKGWAAMVLVWVFGKLLYSIIWSLCTQLAMVFLFFRKTAAQVFVQM